MTAFTASDIPSSINTVEKLHVWTATLLQHLYPEITAIENSNNAQLVAASAPFFVSASSPAVWRNISRASIRLDPNWQRTGKVWQHASDIGSAAIPTEFKS